MKGYDWVRVTNDQVVCTAPGYIGCIIIVSNGSGVADATVYDGESTGDPQILKVLAADDSLQVVRFQPPLKTLRGIYIDIGSNVNEVLIQHSWGPE